MKKWTHSGSLKQEPSAREEKHRKLARRAAAEGIVLLKNEGVLPLKTSDPIALFGSGAEKTVKGGIGSGDVNNRENISVYKGIKEAGASVTNEDWIRDYDKRYKEAREEWKEKILEDARHVQNPFDAYAANPFVLPDGRRITEQDLRGAGAAVYVISRISGEGKDRRLEEGDYYLSVREREDLLYLDRFQIPLILILNSGGPVELTDILQESQAVHIGEQALLQGYGRVRVTYLHHHASVQVTVGRTHLGDIVADALAARFGRIYYHTGYVRQCAVPGGIGHVVFHLQPSFPLPLIFAARCGLYSLHADMKRA